MTRGNQRELARAKNQKKLQQLAKAKGSGSDAAKRKERDADIMRQKQQTAAAKKETSGEK